MSSAYASASARVHGVFPAARRFQKSIFIRAAARTNQDGPTKKSPGCPGLFLSTEATGRFEPPNEGLAAPSTPSKAPYSVFRQLRLRVCWKQLAYLLWNLDRRCQPVNRHNDHYDSDDMPILCRCSMVLPNQQHVTSSEFRAPGPEDPESMARIPSDP